MQNKIYLDYAATTPCDDLVIHEMIPYMGRIFGNPNSLHSYGIDARNALDNARSQIAKLLGSDDCEIIFTSGATESSNISILRTMKYFANRGKSHCLTLKTEHKATLTCFERLRREGYDAELLDVNKQGLLDLEYLESSITDKTALLSICLVNNETGVIQDIENISKICRNKGILLHVDGTQGFGKIPLNMKVLDIDFMSASGHKIYGPKGIGILYCKKENRKYLRIPNANPDVEFGIRAGTVPVALCVGFGKAAVLASKSMNSNIEHIKALREYFIESITSELKEIYINGSPDHNYPGIINVSFRGCEGEALMMEAKNIAVSSGSACTSNKLSLSHVLSAMGISPDIAQSSLRVSIGKMTTKADIDIAISDLVAATNKLRAMSPIWDMIKSGMDIDSIFRRSGGN